VDKIIDGQKTVELRRRFPTDAATGSIALIYSTSPVQAIVGYALIKEVRRLPLDVMWREFGKAACISRQDFDRYFLGLSEGFAILLDDVRELGKPVKAKVLSDKFGFVPPQSYRYLGNEYRSLLKHEREEILNRH